MDVFLRKLAKRLEHEAIDGMMVKMSEIRKNQDKTVGVAEVALGPLYARIIPQVDDGRMFSAEIFTHKMRRVKETDVSPEKLIEDLVFFARESQKPNVVQKAYGKGIEPEVDREKADEEALDDAELDRLIDELEEDWGDSGMPEEGDKAEEAKDARKNVVHTFPKDQERVEGDKTPHKAYNKDMGKMESQSPERGLVSWAKGSRLEEAKEIHGNPVRMDESFKNKVMVFHKTYGVIFVDKDEYKNYLNESKTKLIINNKGEATFGRLDESNEANFIPTILRGNK